MRVWLRSLYARPIDTESINIHYIPIDDVSFDDFDQGILNLNDFLNRTYPLSNEGLSYSKSSLVHHVKDGFIDDSELARIVLGVQLRSAFSQDYGAGVVKSGWIYNRTGRPSSGITYPWLPSAVLVEADEFTTIAHELAHKFDVCDEYNLSNEWHNQDNFLGTSGWCINGDRDDDDTLDYACVSNYNYNGGCPTSTFPDLYPYGNITEDKILRNFMGSSDNPNNPEGFESWISKETYEHLLSELEEKEILERTSSLIVSFLLYQNGTSELISSYVSDGLMPSRQEDFTNVNGSFSIRLLDTGDNILNNITFDAEFSLLAQDGEIFPVDVIPVTIVLPFDENASKFNVVNVVNATILEINRTPNTPTLSMVTNFSNQIFVNQLFNVSWNSSDLDNDTLAYAILFSSDNGSNYTTLEIDYNQTILTLNTLDLPDCVECKIKVLATDGINTNYSISETFTIDKTSPNITAVTIINKGDNYNLTDITIGKNATFNVSVVDEISEVASVLIKIWEGAVGVSNIIWQGFLSFINGDLWSVDIEVNESFSEGDVNYTIYVNDSLGNVGNVSDILNVNEYLFEFEGNNSEVVASFMGNGDLNLRGTCSVSVNCTAPNNSMIFLDEDNITTVAYISPVGDLCLESGNCTNIYQANCNPTEDAFIIQSEQMVNLSYIDFSGKMCLTGNLNENM